MFLYPTALNVETKNTIIEELNKSPEFAALVGEIGKHQTVEAKPQKTEALHLEYAFEEKQIVKTKDVVFVILNDEAIIEAAVQEEGTLLVRAHYSAEKDGKKVIQKAVAEGPDVAVEFELDFDASYFLFVEELKKPNHIETEEVTGEVQAEAWYDGCLVFGDPKTGKQYKYKYCGKSCSSGTPINALDRCCQAHDRCYSNFGKGNNTCDMQLYNCANKTIDPGWYLVADFGLNCAKNGIFGIC